MPGVDVAVGSKNIFYNVLTEPVAPFPSICKTCVHMHISPISNKVKRLAEASLPRHVDDLNGPLGPCQETATKIKSKKIKRTQWSG